MALLRRPSVRSGGHFLDVVLPQPGGLVVAFDDDYAVADAGLLAATSPAARIEAMGDALIGLGERPGAAMLAASC